MENISHLSREDEEIELPPGFRFHPTDEELITHYLSQKVLNTNFCSRIIGEVDLNKVEPWELPWKAKMGEREWYFFSVKDRKYPTGSRTNRATYAGYWKATGKDKEIYRGKSLVGMKKTLVFYKGRAPKGEKSNWVTHEFRLEGKNSLHNFAKTAKNEWVISRIFQKSSGGKRTHISGLVRMRSYGEELEPSNLPPLMDFSTHDVDDDQKRPKAPNPSSHVSHVTCFSEQSDHQNDMAGNFNNPLMPSDSFFSTQFVPDMGNLEYPDSDTMRFLIHNNGEFIKRNAKSEFSNSTEMSSGLSNHEMGHRYFDDKEDPINSGGPVDLDCLWNY